MIDWVADMIMTRCVLCQRECKLFRSSRTGKQQSDVDVLGVIGQRPEVGREQEPGCKGCGSRRRKRGRIAQTWPTALLLWLTREGEGWVCWRFAAEKRDASCTQRQKKAFDAKDRRGWMPSAECSVVYERWKQIQCSADGRWETAVRCSEDRAAGERALSRSGR